MLPLSSLAIYNSFGQHLNGRRSMKLSKLAAALMLALALSAGCDKEPAPAAPPKPAVPAPQAGGSAAGAMQQMTDAAKSAAANASSTVSAEAQKLLDQAQ